MLICLCTPETTGDENKIFSGRMDFPLSKEGLGSAQNISDDFRSSVNHIFTSPSLGSIQFAELFGKFTIVSELADRAGGEYEGRRWDKLKKELPPKKYKLWQREWFSKPLLGETFQDINDRVLKTYKTVIRPILLRGDRVCVISHVDPLRVLLGNLSGLNEEAIMKMDIQPIPYIFRGPF